MAMWICVIAVTCQVVLVEPGPRYSSRIVDTQAGPLRGIIQSSNWPHLEPVEVFYGVPYAAPPVGPLRFIAAQAPLPWRGTRLADTLGSPCPQQPPANHSAWAYNVTDSEDCLWLNIHVPASGSRGMYAPYAVIVYVHGGSFEWGSGNHYDGRILTSFGHVIFITLNYRLGILGFLAAGEDQVQHLSCCFAISDIEAALRWVHNNVGAFGGDPSRVTVVGHDTGAALVTVLLLQASMKGLFHRVALLSGSVLSPWAVLTRPLSQLQAVKERLGCQDSSDTLECLRALPLKALMEVEVEESQFLPRFGTWFPKSASRLIEHAGDTFIDRQILLGLTSLESYHNLPTRYIHSGLDLNEKDEVLRMFVNNVYSYHLREILSAIRNEYTNWSEARESSLSIRDSLLDALSDGQTAAPLLRLAYLHSRRGATTYLFHLAHQSDSSLRKLGLGSVQGDILSHILGHSLSTSEAAGDPQDLAVAHTVLRVFTNFVKTGDPNSPGAEPDYENDKGSSNIWEMFEPVKQQYLSIGKETVLKSHYRGHKIALWHNLIDQLQSSEDDSDYDMYRELEEDEDNLFSGVVRPKTFSRLSTPPPVTAAPPSLECPWNFSDSRPPLQPHDVFRLTGPWGVTLAIGCLLLLCNLLLFASVFHRQFRARAGYEIRYCAPSEDDLMATSQSAPQLATSSFLSEQDLPQVLKRSQTNKFSV